MHRASQSTRGIQCIDAFGVRPEKLEDVAIRHFPTHRIVISGSRNDNVSRENVPITVGASHLSGLAVWRGPDGRVSAFRTFDAGVEIAQCLPAIAESSRGGGQQYPEVRLGQQLSLNVQCQASDLRAIDSPHVQEGR